MSAWIINFTLRSKKAAIPCQNNKDQSFVMMLSFGMSFLHQLPAAKKDMQKPSITTNVWSFLFCQSFIGPPDFQTFLLP